MLLDAQSNQLVMVDYQPGVLAKLHESSLVQANAMRLAKAAHLFKVPVWGTEHAPASLGQTPPELRALYHQTLAKMQFSAVEEGLSEWLRPPAKPPAGNARSLPKHLQKPQSQAPSRDSIVIAGCEAHVCLLQTALHLLEDEFEVWVVTDASSSLSERNRDAAYDRLAGAGAELVSTEMVLFEWLRSAEHPLFKQVLALVKAPN
jgi:nicotinamidase-related amidase